MIKKSLGYVFVIIGLVILALGVKPINEKVAESFPLLNTIDSFILMVVGIGVVVIGAFSLKGAGSRQIHEVPIYHGKNVVGFRRMGKK